MRHAVSIHDAVLYCEIRSISWYYNIDGMAVYYKNKTQHKPIECIYL